MHCQQHLIALLYAFLEPFVNDAESLKSLPDKSLGNQTYKLEYCNQAMVTFSWLNLSDAEVDELGQGVSVGRRLCWSDARATMPGQNISMHPRSSDDGAQSVLNLTVTLTIPGGREASMRRWKRLMMRPHDIPEAPITLGEIIVLDSRLELSSPQSERLSKIWSGQLDAASGSDSQSASEHGKVRTERRKSEDTLGFESGSDGRVHPHDNNGPIRKNSYSRRSRCVDTFCEGFDLKKTCASEGKTPTEEICALCYPGRNLAVIEKHCSKQEASGRRAFYSVCVLLGCFIVVAALLYLLRSFSRRVQRRYRIYRGLCSSQTPRSPATKSRSSSGFQVDSLPALFPGFSFPTKLEVLRRENETGADDASDSTSPFDTLKQKWRQFGAFRRDFRGRIQDVFDIESLDTKHAKGVKSTHKIPVLPRAPNASIRRHFREVKSQAPPDIFSGDGTEIRNDGSAVFHPTSLCQTVTGG